MMVLRLWVLATAALLVVAPVGLGERVVLMLPLWIAGLAGIGQPREALAEDLIARPARGSLILAPLLALWLGLLLIAVVRGVLASSMTVTEALEHSAIWISVAVLLAPWLRPHAPERDRRYLVVGTIAAAVVVVALNELLYALGISSAVVLERTIGVPATVLGLLGFAVDRAAFPLGSGLNAFAAMSGAGLVGASVILFRWEVTATIRLLLIAAIAACAYAILAVDSRTSMVLAPACALVAILAPVALLRQASWLAPVIPFMPLLIAAIGLVAAQAEGVASISRSPLDLATAGNRVFVWQAVSSEFATFQPQHLFGFGFFGQTTSGVVYGYPPVVGSGGFDESRLTAHNAVFQWGLDTGYVGAFLYVVVVWLVLRQAGRRLGDGNAPMGRVLIGMVVFLALVGTTESVPTPYARETLLMFLCLTAASSTGSGAVENGTVRSPSTSPGS